MDGPAEGAGPDAIGAPPGAVDVAPPAPDGALATPLAIGGDPEPTVGVALKLVSPAEAAAPLLGPAATCALPGISPSPVVFAGMPVPLSPGLCSLPPDPEHPTAPTATTDASKPVTHHPT